MNDSPVLVILAGGKSSRMGKPKGLLEFKKDYWILEQISRYKKVHNPKVIIGLGHDHQLYFDKISWFKNALEKYYNYDGVEVKVVINSTPEKGKFSTLLSVLKQVETNREVLILPIDVPLLTLNDLKKIITEKNNIVLPRWSDKNGHPVKIAASIWNTFFDITIDNNEARLDFLIKKNNSYASLINVSDSSVNQNINTKEKWNNYLSQNFE